jgi:Bacterial TSP3 repeat
VAIAKNIAQGTFSLSGPVSRSGQGLGMSITNAPPGQYIAHFDDVPFYQTPADQTNAVAPGDSLLLVGAYTFTDANHNGISDAWEQYYFGTVATNRTRFTDTDGDGMTDLAEFLAGTNPTNATSKLSFISTSVQTNNTVKMQWAAVPGRAYEVLTSTNLTTWTPITDWILATGSPMTYTVTNLSRGSHLYRVQVHQ